MPHTVRCSAALAADALLASVTLLATGAALAQGGGPAPLPAITEIVVNSPLTRSGVDFSSSPALNAVTSALTSDESIWAQMDAAQAVQLAALPLGPDLTVDVQLHRIDPFDADSVIVNVHSGPRGRAISEPIARPTLQCWGGSIVGSPGSSVFLAHSPWFTHGFVQVDGHTYTISSGRPTTSQPIASFDQSALPDGAITWTPFTCATVTPQGVIPEEGGVADAPPCRQTKVAFDTDNELLGVFGGDVAATAAYVALIDASMTQIYTTAVNARIIASYIRIWTDPDPWTQPDSGSELGEFVNYWNANMGGVTRNAAMMVSARNLGGGVAYLSALCNAWAYSVCGNIGGYFPYPLQDHSDQNWDIMVCSHELGHNFGSPHTHDYTPPYDGCGSNPQDCSQAWGGTIMSYCHLCPGGMSNIVLQFAPPCINSITSYLDSNGCNMLGAPQPPWAVSDTFTTLAPQALILDVLANDVAVNCENIVINSFTQGAHGTVSLVQGGGPGGRDELLYNAAGGFTGSDTFTYTLRDSSVQFSAPATVTLNVPALWPASSVVGDSAGLKVAYYALSNPVALPDFTTLTPYLSTVTSQINYPSTNGNFANSGRADNVGAVWVGWISVPSDAFYTLSLNSDDGSRLYVNNTLVVDDDGLHGMLEKSKTVPLQAGKHPVRVEFFEAGGGAGCILSIEGGGAAKQAVPAAQLTRGGAALIGDLTFDGHVNGADLAVLLARWNTSDPAADLNGDGTVNGADLGILISHWTG